MLDAAIFYAKQVVGSENFRDGMDLGLAQDDDPKKKHEEADIGIVTARTRIEQLENIKAGLQEYMLAAMAERKEPPSRG